MNSYPLFNKNKIRKYPFLLLLIPLTSGIFFQYSFAVHADASAWVIPLLIAGIVTIIFHSLRTKTTTIQLLRNSTLTLLIFFLGASLSYYRDERNSSNWYGNMLRRADSVHLRVTGPAEPKLHTFLIPVSVTAIYANNKRITTTGAIRLYIYKQDVVPEFSAGDELIIPADKIMPVKNTGNPFAFNYAAYAARNGLFHQAFISGAAIRYYPGQRNRQPWFAGIRSSMIHNIRLNVTDKTTAALIEATMLNERALLDDEIWKAYSITGIVHIIAISGMHVTLLFNILLFFLLWIKNKRLEWLKYFIALPLVWFYIALTGFPPSAVRAAVMFTLLALGVKLSRETHPINILMATAFILLCYNPFWLYDTGFQLSFLAVLSILLFYQPITMLFYFRNKSFRFLWQTFSVSLAAQVLTFPLAIYYFHQFPLWVLIANIPATVFSLLLMIGSIVLLVLSTFITCTWLGNILTLLTKAFHKIIHTLSDYTPTYFRELFIDAIDFWLLMLLIALLAILLHNKRRSYFIASIISFIALSADISLQYYVAAGQKSVIVYNTPHLSVVDFLDGRTMRRFGSSQSLLDKKTINYVLLPAQLGYHIRQVTRPAVKPYWFVHEKYVCFLEGVPDDQKGISKVDYLIVSNKCVFTPEEWLALKPEKIIIDSSLPGWKAAVWKKMLSQKGIAVHSVPEDGAWLFPE